MAPKAPLRRTLGPSFASAQLRLRAGTWFATPRRGPSAGARARATVGLLVTALRCVCSATERRISLRSVGSRRVLSFATRLREPCRGPGRAPAREGSRGSSPRSTAPRLRCDDAHRPCSHCLMVVHIGLPRRSASGPHPYLPPSLPPSLVPLLSPSVFPFLLYVHREDYDIYDTLHGTLSFLP